MSTNLTGSGAAHVQRLHRVGGAAAAGALAAAAAAAAARAEAEGQLAQLPLLDAPGERVVLQTPGFPKRQQLQGQFCAQK